ncbi:hypothetical protein HK101_005327 [Irineochytrium annulatum]|nr:hypothetical protein HK101_005327 [Irineochytrium annulatum]
MQQDDTTTDSDDAENNAMVMAIVPLWDAPPNAMPKGARPTVGGLRMPRPSRRQSSVTFSSTTTTHTTTTRTVTHSKHSPRRPAFNGVGRSGVVGVDAPLNASQIGGANERLYDDVAKVTSVRKSVSQVWVERNEVGYVEAREEGKWDGMDDGV